MKATFLVFLSLAAGSAAAADPVRQQEVATRGAAVMPFSLPATQHIFTRTGTGGEQTVLARRQDDTAQAALVRRHLAEVAAQFAAGDFSAPRRIHGDAMPGLAELAAAPRGAIRVTYRDVPGGGRIDYVAADPALRAALHRWFDAQLDDHGADAAAGHHAH